jgi:hypothetical protein
MITVLALLPLLIAQSAAPPRVVVPDAPDLMIKTRRTAEHQGADVTTEIIYLKGARQRREQTIEGPHASAAGQRYGWIEIALCDERRMLVLNPAVKTYAYRPIQDPAALIASLRSAGGVTPPPVVMTLGPPVTITVDAVDTGERRRYDKYVARRVVTTRTVEPKPGANLRASVQRTDGWYIDAPPAGCIDWESSVTSHLSLSKTPPDRVQFKQRGNARRGYPIAETNRMSTSTYDGQQEIVRTIELVEISEAPLDDALFTPPADYRAALTRPDGSYDLSKPDTMMNRLESYREVAASWANYLLRNGLLGILPGTQPPARY